MDIDITGIHRVLARAPNWVGDAVMSLPALEALKENLPGSTLVVLAKPWVVPVLESQPYVDQVMAYDRKAYPRGVYDIFRTASEIKSQGFDLAVLFPNAFEAALLAWLARIPRRLGYDRDGRRLLLSHAVPARDKNHKKQTIHQVEYYLGILEGAGWSAKTRDPRLFLKEAAVSYARSLLRMHGIGDSDYLLGLSPGAAFGPAKRWPPERFAAVADMASERWGAKVVILGSGNEYAIGEEVAGRMRSPSVNLSGKTGLAEAAAVIGRCSGFVTNDSGLMHVASALDVPTVALFGSTSPVATGPRSRKARVVRSDVNCSPCMKSDCREDFRCLRAIEPAHVWKELEGLKEERN
jgi:heptosyltransferase II